MLRAVGRKAGSAPKEKRQMAGRSTSLSEPPERAASDIGNGDDAGSEASASLAPAVTRAATILDLLALDPAATLGTSELSRRLGLPKSSIANICAALVEARLLRRVGQGFALGRRLAELGGAYLAAVDQVQEFHEASAQLETASEETMQLAVLDGLEVTYIARHDGRQPIRLASEIGRRLPANCTAIGKAALAALDSDDLANRLRGVQWLPTMTPKSHRTVTALLADLDAVRARGFAIDDEETAEGVVCYGIAIPRRGPSQGPYGASVTLLKARATPERRADLVTDLRRLAEMLSNPLQPDLSTRP
jgi:IclR family transcriptional regulator, blcABC operon repressor